MFFNAPANPTKLKQTVYLVASTILGLLLGLIAHALVEMAYLSFMAIRGGAVIFYGGCALPFGLQIIIWMLGAVGGFFLGRFWWRKVYVERAWADKK